jgi:predicted MPP superfamily phosphohydrolase
MDPLREEECRRLGADVYSLEWLQIALDETKPDLVVLTGDQLNGQETSWDARSVILKWAPLLYERQIPWTIIFGNHDEEVTDLDHEGQMGE